MLKRKWLNYVIAYLLWFVTMAIGLWWFFITRSAFQAGLSVFYIKGSDYRAFQAGFYDKAFSLFLGLLWLILIVVSEERYRTGAERGDFYKRFASLVGPLLILVFAFDLILALLIGISMISWSRWFILALELITGVMLLRFTRRQKSLLPLH